MDGLGVVCVSLLSKETATTEIETDGQTLTLHDALPICDADADSNVGADRDQLAGLHLGCQQWPCRRRQPWLFSETASQCAAGFRDIEGAVGACPMGSQIGRAHV